MASINRGDNTGAFGGDFLRIYLNNPNNLYIQKAVFQINGNLEKEFINPVFPLRINFTGQETEMLQQVNHCKLALWDGAGRRRTADGKFTFFVKENNIQSPDEQSFNYEDVVLDDDNSVYFNLTDAEFAAEFVINATPSKVSELELDIPIMTIDKIIAGRNIHTYNDGEYITISADLETTIDWENIVNKPTINGFPLEGNVEIHLEDEIPNADWNATEGPAEILNKPNFALVAYTGNYNDIVGAPTVSTKVSQLENDANYISEISLDEYYTKEEIDEQLETGSYVEPLAEKISDLEQQHDVDVKNLQSQIDNKVDETEFLNMISTKADIDYIDDLLEEKVDVSLLGKGNLQIYNNNSLIATFNANSQIDVPVDLQIPEKISDLENDMNFVTQDQLDTNDYVTREEYDQDTNEYITKDYVGTGILTLQTNGNVLGTFNANTSNNTTLNIEIPQNISELTDDIGYLTQDDLNVINIQIDNIQTQVDNAEVKIEDLQTQLDDKVTVESGKTLISQSELDRLSQLTDYDDTELRELISTNISNIATLNEYLSNKVDKEAGKGLSTNDFTDEYLEELDKVIELAETTDISLSRLTTRVTTAESTIEDHTLQIETLTTDLNDESQQRINVDNYLQEQIEALTVKSTVKDVVATDLDLDTYDKSELMENDVICVLKDSTQNETTTYYRWDGSYFNYIGSEGEYYTKSTANSLFVPQTRTINGHALSSDITLTASDVGAISSDMIIGDGTITIQKNSQSVGIFTLNQSDNLAINLVIPEKTSDLENDNDFITLETLFEYIGEVSEDNSLQDQIDAIQEEQSQQNSDITALQELLTGSLDGLPTVAVTGSYNDLIDKPDIPEKLSELENDVGYITADEVASAYVTPEDLPTKLSEFENDRGYVTNSAIGRGTLTCLINGTEVGTWMANEKEDYTWNIPVDNELSETSTLPVENNVITNEVIRVDTSCVHLTGDETITDTKTFENIVYTGSAIGVTLDNDDSSTNLATTEYVKNQDYCTNTDAVHKEGEETIVGDKTFTGTVTLNTATGITLEPIDNSTNLATTAYVKSQDYAPNSTVMHLVGNETAQGDKTFNDTVTFSGIVNLSKYAHVPTPDETDESNYYTDLVVNIEYVQNYVSDYAETVNAQNQALQDQITALLNRVEQLETTSLNVKESYSDGTSGYYILNNNYCVQWGYAETSGDAVTLYKSYNNTDYNINFGMMLTDTENITNTPYGVYSDKAEDNFVLTFANTDGIDWCTRGFITEIEEQPEEGDEESPEDVEEDSQEGQ